MSDTEIGANIPLEFLVESGKSEYQVILEIIAQEPLSDGESALLCKTIDGLIAAAGNGMFCGKYIPPAISSLELLSKVSIGEIGVKWHCIARNLDLSVYRVLIGLVNYYAYYSKPIARLSIRANVPSYMNLIPLGSVLEQKLYIYKNLGFAVQFEQPDRSDKNRRFQIEFAHKPSKDQINYILKTIEIWDILCYGGFPIAGRNFYESGIAPGAIYMFDKYTAEHVIDLFEVSEEAFNAVINLAGRFHAKITPVSMVSIF